MYELKAVKSPRKMFKGCQGNRFFRDKMYKIMHAVVVHGQIERVTKEEVKEEIKQMK